MKAHLLYPDRDLDLDAALPDDEEDLTLDLGLDTLFDAMADGDDLLREVARHAVLTSLQDVDEIRYRQQVLRDCVDHPEAVNAVHDLAVEGLSAEKEIHFSFVNSPGAILDRSVKGMEFLLDVLARLRGLADQHAPDFRSPGFTTLFAMLARELDDTYVATVRERLQELRFTDGVQLSTALGPGAKAAGYTLRQPVHQRTWRERLSGAPDTALTLHIADRDMAGAAALGELRDKGVNLAANALAQAADHILAFFTMLRRELAFYLGCLNLRARLTTKGEPLCLPEPHPAGGLVLTAKGLYDPGLSLRLEHRVVGNDLDADGRDLLMVTGANQGGKSTFLRSVGLAQLMLQSGMFVAAREYAADLRARVLTHYKREEDSSMRSGKFDEELARMSTIADRVLPGSMVLFNESFAATNEREGSEIARQIVRALLEAGVKVVYVTHLFDLAHSLYSRGGDNTLFLRAERRDQGERTFRIVTGEPLATSYGEDLYARIFHQPPPSAPQAP